MAPSKEQKKRIIGLGEWIEEFLSATADTTIIKTFKKAPALIGVEDVLSRDCPLCLALRGRIPKDRYSIDELKNIQSKLKVFSEFHTYIGMVLSKLKEKDAPWLETLAELEDDILFAAITTQLRSAYSRIWDVIKKIDGEYIPARSLIEPNFPSQILRGSLNQNDFEEITDQLRTEQPVDPEKRLSEIIEAKRAEREASPIPADRSEPYEFSLITLGKGKGTPIYRVIIARILFEFLMAGGQNYYTFCKQCGKFTLIKKSGKKFCSDACRSAYGRGA